MRVKRPWLWIIGLLILLEIIRRSFATLYCYTELRYSPFLIERSGLLEECTGRHLYFPFRF